LHEGPCARDYELLGRLVSRRFALARLGAWPRLYPAKAFARDNDAFGEHDFGAIELSGEPCFWKIDYDDLQRKGRSADPTVTVREPTMMRADEY
jgi:hypothetical protein